MSFPGEAIFIDASANLKNMDKYENMKYENKKKWKYEKYGQPNLKSQGIIMHFVDEINGKTQERHMHRTTFVLQIHVALYMIYFIFSYKYKIIKTNEYTCTRCISLYMVWK